MKYARIVLSALIVFAATATTSFSQVLRQADLQKFYGSLWIPLPLPDSRIAPGTIVTIKKGQVAFESSLDKCGAPQDVMKAITGNDSTITGKSEGEYGADAALKIGGVTAGPEFSKAKKTSLKLENHHPEGLDRIVLATWLKDSAMKLPPACESLLTEKDVFLVQESYRVDKGRVTLYDNRQAKLSLGGVNLGIVKLDANAKNAKIVDDSIEFSAPMYTAIRRLKYLKGGGLKTLGTTSSPPKDDDAKARAMLYPAKKE
jgi:hypothetical protein